MERRTVRVTGVPWDDWKTAAGGGVCFQRVANLFKRMHETVLNYARLLRKNWDHQLRQATSAQRRAQMLRQMFEELWEEES